MEWWPRGLHVGRRTVKTPWDPHLWFSSASRLLVLICSVTAIVAAAGLVLPVVVSCFTGSARPTPPRRLYEELSGMVQSEVVLCWFCPFCQACLRKDHR
ncbi:hypothetical protein B296_00044148 [Ensete ventricosum]|uniref:Uncharacterized protein n=1 Tax=Ensete ventricosum TaxID=4639 RepID=A0A426ZBX4_ENSVE|nr:hypothetical protein B296_00044148 [Ensete ventricosum]